jgi:hypothetical protein
MRGGMSAAAGARRADPPTSPLSGPSSRAPRRAVRTASRLGTRWVHLGLCLTCGESAVATRLRCGACNTPPSGHVIGLARAGELRWCLPTSVRLTQSQPALTWRGLARSSDPDLGTLLLVQGRSRR